MAEATTRMFEAARIEPGHTVLDVGTGTGETAVLAAERVGPQGRVIAVDTSAQMLEQAKAKIQKEGIANVELREMNGARLTLEDASVDVLIGRNAMQFLPGWPEPLSGFHRVMREGARLAFVVWASKEQNPFFDSPISVAAECGLLRLPPDNLRIPYRLSDGQQLRADLVEAGFKGVGIDEVRGEVTVDTPDALLSYLCDGPMYRVPASEMSEEEHEIYDRALAESLERFRQGGQYRVEAISLLARATR